MLRFLMCTVRSFLQPLLQIYVIFRGRSRLEHLSSASSSMIALVLEWDSSIEHEHCIRTWALNRILNFYSSIGWKILEHWARVLHSSSSIELEYCIFLWAFVFEDCSSSIVFAFNIVVDNFKKKNVKDTFLGMGFPSKLMTMYKRKFDGSNFSRRHRWRIILL